MVISGAGPAGLLCASLLLARNKETTTNATSTGNITYDVTLIDGRQDFGALTQDELSKSFRSWMLGLADHGLDALRSVPTLYENYVSGEGTDIGTPIGILIREVNIYLGKKKLSNKVEVGSKDVPEGFIVDRNFVVAAIARYLRENHGGAHGRGSVSDDHYTALYNTTCQYVDYENKQVLVRERNTETKNEQYIPYDLLIGCDGVRSTVREALIKRHSNFACEITDIFQEFKAVHIKCPDSVCTESVSLLPDCLPCMQGIALPETGGKLNVSMGCPRNLFDDDLPEELKSDSYKTVSKYIKENFKAFELEDYDYDDFAKQWVNQRWNQTGMVHCNFYHSVECGIVLMGDAAHATSPSIGMGMNTALRDAQIFSTILRGCGDDLNEALPAYSEARVKEGNSLSDLALHLYCMDKAQQTKETLHMVIRGALHNFFPKMISNHPQAMIGLRGVGLCDVYGHATNLGIMGKHRAINDGIRRKYFEESTGMVKSPEKFKSCSKMKMMSFFFVAAAGLVALAGVLVQKYEYVAH